MAHLPYQTIAVLIFNPHYRRIIERNGPFLHATVTTHHVSYSHKGKVVVLLKYVYGYSSFLVNNYLSIMGGAPSLAPLNSLSIIFSWKNMRHCTLGHVVLYAVFNCRLVRVHSISDVNVMCV